MLTSKLMFRRLENVNNPCSIHGIYPYRGKISALDAQQVIKQLPKKGVLLDPFCGSGTIIYEGRKWGLTVIGVDSNPLAVQISKAKLSSIKKDKSVKKIEGFTESINLNKEIPMPELAAKFFHEKTSNQIMHLMKFYNEFDDYEKAAFLGSICLAARGCNNYKWSSTQIGSVSKNKKKINFFSKFLMKIIKHAYPTDFNNSKVIEGDTRNLGKYIKPKSVNFVYTSPPYFDGLDYTSNYTRIIYNLFGNNIKNIKKGLIQNYNRYSKDMKRCFKEIKKVTSDDAIIIFVVGDKKKGNEVISGKDFFRKTINEEPTYIIEREYTGTASSIWDKVNKTKRKEQIIVWDKSKW